MAATARKGDAPDALALLGRRSDLLQLQGQADLPARFFAVFEGGLEATAGSDESGDLERMFARNRVVGIDADLLFELPDDDARVRRYRDNLVQKLAARRVGLLAVLRDSEFSQQSLFVSFLRHGDSGGVAVGCQPAKQGLAEWQQALERAGFLLVVECDEGKELARLVFAARDGSPLVGARDSAPGNLVELLELSSFGQPDESRLRSRWFSLDVLRREGAKVADLLADCARLQEQESLMRVLEAWSHAKARMQEDTRSLTQLEVLVVATRPIGPLDQEHIAKFRDVARIWMMTERLRVAGDNRTRMRARYVWPDAVSALLARLCLGSREASARGMFAWRSFVCGIAVDPKGFEKLRAEETQRILESAGPSDQELTIERKGPFEPLETEWRVDREPPDSLSWDDGSAVALVDQRCSETTWREEHRKAGAALGKERMKLDRAGIEAEGNDPERAYSQQYWSRIQQSPGHLRMFAAARLFRGDDATALHKRLPAHLQEWREDVLDARRKLAREREDLRQSAEELDRARRFHIGIGWRMLVGSAVAIYAGFLSLNILRVLLTFQTGAWASGVWIFIAAIAGGWLGAFLPMWVERQRGLAAAAHLSNRLADVDRAHREAVAETHEVFRDAEGVRQTIRITSIHRRTTLLAERAWNIVRAAQDAVARDFERRKLLGSQAGAVESIERLAIEDRQDWRNASVIRPKYEHARDMPERAVWKPAFDEVAAEFRSAWKENLHAEDPYLTGFLRAAALQRLVQELADLVGARIERELMAQTERNCEQAGSPIRPEVWSERMIAAIGPDAASHALLSVLDDHAVQRTSGHYRIYRKDLALAAEVCRQITGARQGFADVEPKVVEAIPLGGFAMVFHEVPIRWSGVGLVLDESAAHDFDRPEALQ